MTGRVLFADLELVARIEAAECSLLEEGAAAARQREQPGPVISTRIGSGIATWVAPASPLNKVAGLGFAECDLDARLAQVEHEFHARETAVQVELASLVEPTVARTLTRRGYQLVGFENVLGRGLDRAPGPGDPRAADITVSRDTSSDVSTWLDVVVTGFASPDTQGVPSHEEFPREVLERDIGDMAQIAGFQRFLARRAGREVGAASMRLANGIAQLCGAATLPAERRRGVQSSLLAQRLALAADAGCDVAIVTTQPGSKSQQNAQRKGFELLYTRAVLVLEPG